MARGNIEKRGENTWRIRVYLGTDPDGKQRYYRETVHGTKKAAQQRLTELLRELDTGGFVEPSRETFAEYLERWLRDYAEHAVRPSTLRGYAMMIRRHIAPALGHIPLAKIRPMDLQQYYADALRKGRQDGRGEALSPQTVLHHHRLIHRALEQAVRWGLVARNVADAVEPPRVSRAEQRTWTPEEARQFLEALKGHRLYALYATAIMTGMRRGELLGLQWDDVNLEAGWLSVRQALLEVEYRPRLMETKSRSSVRRVSIPPELVEILKAHRIAQAKERLAMGPMYEDHGLVFCQPNGRPLHPHNVSARQFPRLCEAAGVPRIRFHDLRHTHATWLLAAGVHPKVVAARLGHSSTNLTLDTYSHVIESVEREAGDVVGRLLFSRSPQAV